MPDVSTASSSRSGISATLNNLNKRLNMKEQY